MGISVSPDPQKIGPVMAGNPCSHTCQVFLLPGIHLWRHQKNLIAVGTDLACSRSQQRDFDCGCRCFDCGFWWLFSRCGCVLQSTATAKRAGNSHQRKRKQAKRAGNSRKRRLTAGFGCWLISLRFQWNCAVN